MASNPGDQGVWNGMPCTVFAVTTRAGQQYDTIIIDQPVARIVPDSQVQTVATPAPAVASPTTQPGPGPAPHVPPKPPGK